MTRDDIIKLAREAGSGLTETDLDNAPWVESFLERFAALVATAEREACAVVGGAAAMAGADYQGVAAAIRARGQA
jgi:hypothetical protein